MLHNLDDQKPENPAKTYLRRYKSMLQRRESLQRSIDGAYERATSCTQRLKAVNVSGGNAAYDRMAEDIVGAVDSTAKLMRVIREIDEKLSDILSAIDSVPDETQKTILTMRYIEGLSWEQIQFKTHYAERQVFILHGRGLRQVNLWMESQQIDII